MNLPDNGQSVQATSLIGYAGVQPLTKFHPSAHVHLLHGVFMEYSLFSRKILP